MLFLTIFSLGLVLFLYSLRCLNAPIASGIRYALTVCRFVFIALVLWLLTNPQTREIRRIIVPPVLYVAIDDSLSMSYPPDPLQVKSGRALSSRWGEVLKFLSRKIPVWERQGFEIRYNLFSASGHSPDISLPWLAQFPKSATPSASGTNLAAVIAQYERERDTDRPSCLLLFTDGQWNQGANPLSTISQQTTEADSAISRIYSFGIGTAHTLFDIVLKSVNSPKIARTGESFSLKIGLAARGPFPANPVTLKILGQKEDGSQIFYEEQEVYFSDSRPEASIALEISALEKGQYLFTIEAIPQKGEWLTTNNRLTRGVQVRDITDRALLLTSGPDWDFKFLKRVLESQEAITAEVFLYRDHRLFPLGDRPWVKHQSASVQDLISPEEEPAPASLAEIQSNLSRWSVVLLHNFIFEADTRPFVNQLNEFVTNGGGLVVLPGKNSSLPLSPEIRDGLPAPLSRTYIMNTQPILLDMDANPDSPYRPAVLNDNGLELPPLTDYFLPRPAYESGQVLLQGKTLFDESVPLCVLHRYGLGRIVIMGSQSFWRLNLLTGRDVLTSFWLTTLYQCNPTLRSQSGQILVDGYLFEPHEKVHIAYASHSTILSATESGVPLTVFGPTRQEKVWLHPNPATLGQFEGQYSPSETGPHIVANAVGDSTAEFIVESNSQELYDLRQNIEVLRAIAKQSGGDYANQPAWDDLAAKIPSTSILREEGHSIFTGEKWWMAFTLIFFLAFEWFLRWRNGLP